MVKLIVFNNRIGPILGRHPWVFSGALKQIPDGIESGTPVHLVDENNRFLAQGYFNSYSQIAVRIWSWDENEKIGENDKEDKMFFEKRIKQAYELRKQFVENKNTDSYRVINSENDFLPGLIVDKYSDYLSVQFHNRGIEFWKTQIVDVLKKILKPKGIYERSDVRDRRRDIPTDNSVISSEQSDEVRRYPVVGESLSGLLLGKVPEQVKITENGYKFLVDIIGGQKTGFFLDQRDKRKALEKYSNKKTVLNCFSYTGGFSVYALGGGAKKVVSVDVSQSALDLAKENIKLNKLDIKKCDFVCDDVKKYLNLNPGGEMFDVIVLDPPAFVKDRRKVREGLFGYRNINEAALKILKPGGILVTCSCSAHVSLIDFRYMLSEAAGRARKTVQILETFTHGVDHPELVAFTEGEYLKCIFAQVS